MVAAVAVNETPAPRLAVAPVAEKTLQGYAGTTKRFGRTPSDAHPLLLCGKRGHQALNAALSPGESARSRVFFIRVRNSGKCFTVDSGAAVSAIAPTSADRQRHNSGFTLQAVNQTSIKTYGKCMLKLDLGLRRSFSHMFVAADVPSPIIGADFLALGSSRVTTGSHSSAFRLRKNAFCCALALYFVLKVITAFSKSRLFNKHLSASSHLIPISCNVSGTRQQISGQNCLINFQTQTLLNTQ